eukprot:7351009-Prymnesium_polylepis.1
MMLPPGPGLLQARVVAGPSQLVAFTRAAAKRSSLRAKALVRSSLANASSGSVARRTVSCRSRLA